MIMCDHNDVPMMFRSQVSGRCQIQRLIPKEKRQDADDWVEEWVKNAGKETPEFSSQVRSQDYEIAWRFVSNSGQDEGAIRPVIGAKGWPYYPGASMKGAFLRACWEQQKEGKISREKVLQYCGGEIIDKDGTKKTQPGILRFHGGYPKDDRWKNSKSLVDVVHPQEKWQVTGEENGKHSAFIQISLFKPTFVFGISVTKQGEKEIAEDDWKQIWEIWERALVRGIGCRVSAGYGQPKPQTLKNKKIYRQDVILPVELSGQGICSQLINKTGEFRPNMFKAALRGHTLRLFSGLTDDATAQALTKELWGGFSDRGSVVGLLGIGFQEKDLFLDDYEYDNGERRGIMPVYYLDHGTLNILTTRNVSETEKKRIQSFLFQLMRFSMLLGGFGKSWRRADHKLFFPKYLTGATNNNKNINPRIGCHWQFLDHSQQLYIPIKRLTDITRFLDKIRSNTNDRGMGDWITQRGYQLSTEQSSYREAWHPDKVQVWARFASSKSDSEAIHWFHDAYGNGESIQKTKLTGWAADKSRNPLTQISRIWHRMYPHYILGEDKKSRERVGTGYVELLTIFPDRQAFGEEKEKQDKFLKFLRESKVFTQVWPLKKKHS